MNENTSNNGDGAPSGPTTNQTRIQRNWHGEGTPAGSVTDAIATVTGTPPLGLQPLYESIDPDALDRILEAGSASPSGRSTLTVSFRHAGCAVTITADGQLTVRHPADG